MAEHCVGLFGSHLHGPEPPSRGETQRDGLLFSLFWSRDQWAFRIGMSDVGCLGLGSFKFTVQSVGCKEASS